MQPNYKSKQAQQISQHQQIQQQVPVYEKTVPFSQARAIIWQVKFALNNVNSKKSMTSALTEIQNLSEHYGKEFDKYVLKELIEMLDLKDINKSQKDKNENQVLCQMLSQELARTSLKPDFLQYFSEIAQPLYEHRVGDFLNDLTKKLKLPFNLQLLIALSLYESSKEDFQIECKINLQYQDLINIALKVFRSKLAEINANQQIKIDGLPEYSIHKILYLLQTHIDMINDEQMQQILVKIQESYQIKIGTHFALRESLDSDLYSANAGNSLIDESSLSFLKEGGGLDIFDKACKVLEPWEILLDLGPQATNDYNNFLMNVFSDFKEISEKTMAKTLLYLSLNHNGHLDQTSRMVYAIYDECKKVPEEKKKGFEDNKKGAESNKKVQGKNQQIKENNEKKTQVTTWNIENLSRLFRELYSGLNWLKVFEALTEVEDEIILDTKSFLIFLQLFNKCKPQNIQFPLNIVLDQKWVNPALQVNFIENCIHTYLEKKEKSINFLKTLKRQEMIDEIQGYKDKIQPEMLHIWLSVELSERLIELSNSGQFQKVRAIFESPLKTLPDYLLLTLSHTKPTQGNLMLDELLSLLLPQFLGNHINSIPVLQQLWKYNQQLMIRGICELCRHDQRIMNLSRVLDITQEVKESLLPIVDCEDYYFAVNLGILAGKRDFLHYDVWLQNRIQIIGTPFIKALLKYIKEHIIAPINEYIRRHTNEKEISVEALESFKNAILEKSHLSKEKLCLTLEHLQNPTNSQNQLIKADTLDKIKDVCLRTAELFPSYTQPTQNSEEIDNAANEYFQRVFSAAPEQVDQKISELIDIMQKFKESEVKKQQEIYACMLHSLFDEYRFLHRYPQQYLEKIAKLFGQIIKNKIIEGTLHEIALKFAYEAFRREGRRQKFGVIVIKQFFEMLPTFPSFFKDIYEIRSNLSQSEPQMLQDLERIWESSKALEDKRIAENDDSKDQSQTENKKAGRNEKSIFSQQKEEELKQSLLNQQKNDKKQLDPQSNMFTKFGKNKQQVLGGVGELVQENEEIQKQQNVSQVPKVQQTGQDIPRTTTPLMNTGQVFIPSYKTGNNASANNSGGTQSEQTGLSITSAAFKRGAPAVTTTTNTTVPTITTTAPQFLQTSAGQGATAGLGAITTTSQNLTTQMNPNVSIFLPSNTKSPLNVVGLGNQGGQLQMQQPVNQQLLQFQEMLNAKFQKAIFDNTKIRFDDIIEDTNFLNNGPNMDTQEAIKRICNQVVKSNLQLKLVELKEFLGGPNVISNLQWFIHFLLTKRVATSGGQNLYPVYIDIIRQVGIKSSVEYTIQQIVDCFKKCLAIDEELFNKVIHKAPSQSNPIKAVLINIGQFLGILTLGNNRPILAKEIDLKQLLVEGIQQDKLKYVVTFVCRILKEGNKSNVFKITNPWISGLLSLLKEIKDSQQQSNNNEISNEVESLLKSMGLNAPYNEVQSTGILRALQTQQFSTASQQIELSYLLGKANLLLPQQQVIAQQQNNRAQMTSPAPSSFQNNQLRNLGDPLRNLGGLPQTSQSDLIAQQQQQQQFQQQQQQQILDRVTVSNELLIMINKLFTQTESSIKKMVGEAVDSSIVEILPPVVDRSVTIALITTRELVLKDFAYDGDPQKILKAADLIVKNLAGSLALVTCREPLKMSLTTNLRKSLTNLLGQQNQQLDPQQETQIQEIAQQASKENLELGCKLIKKAVIEKAQKKVKEEPFIARAIEARQRAQDQKQQFFKDENVISQISDLPPQLQPSPNGLSDAQFQVYEDFSRLSLTQKKLQQEQEGGNQQQIQQQQMYEQADCETLLKAVEQNGLTPPLKNVLISKIKDLNTDKSQDDEKKKIESYVQKWVVAICKNFEDKQTINEIQPLIDTLSLISTQCTFENMSQKITSQFLSLNDNSVFNVELNLLLIRNKIISVSEWDKQLGHFLNSSIPQINENLFKFLAGFLKISIQEMRILQYHQLSYLMEIIEKISQNKDIAIYFSQVLEDYKKKPSVSQQNMIKQYFTEWVTINYSESNNIEQDINRFFHDFTQTEFIKDPEMVSNFCKVMVETSIEKALYMSNGQKRPADRLDYRYIDCFIKLIIVLMKTQQFNKHKFMIKVFDSIQEVLDEEHRIKKHEFNQKPYYRLLIRVLTTINVSQCFNSQTQQLILISLADLFNKLNPNKYPAFAFSWIELISHKHFMPHFLKVNTTVPSQSQQQQQQIPTQILRKSQQNPSQNSQSGADPSNSDTIFYDKYFRFKELIVNLFTFLKMNMNPTLPSPQSLVAFYQATLRVCLVILNDFPEFFCDFHFNFVNSLPENCIQLRNIILSSFPPTISPPNPFQRLLKVDLLLEVQAQPRILSNYENYLQLMNLREDLENYVRTKNQDLITNICDKMMSSEEVQNGRKKTHCNVINAVVLFIANQSCVKPSQQQQQQQQLPNQGVPEITNKESMELFRLMVLQLNTETRWCLLNSIVNELRYPNNHTYYFSCIILYLFAESNSEAIQEQIARILFERLQVNRPHPWGLMISFRELIQNPKYGFMRKNFISQNQASIDQLFATRLEHFKPFLPRQQQQQQLNQQQLPQESVRK